MHTLTYLLENQSYLFYISKCEIVKNVTQNATNVVKCTYSLIENVFSQRQVLLTDEMCALFIDVGAVKKREKITTSLMTNRLVPVQSYIMYVVI